MRTLIVSANLALMLSAVFAPFFGAIVMVFGGVVGRAVVEVVGVVWLLGSNERIWVICAKQKFVGARIAGGSVSGGAVSYQAC